MSAHSNRDAFGNPKRVNAMVAEEVKRDEKSAQEVATEWRKNPEYSMVRVTSFKVGKRPDRSKGERQQVNYAVRAYAR